MQSIRCGAHLNKTEIYYGMWPQPEKSTVTAARLIKYLTHVYFSDM